MRTEFTTDPGFEPWRESVSTARVAPQRLITFVTIDGYQGRMSILTLQPDDSGPESWWFTAQLTQVPYSLNANQYTHFAGHIDCIVGKGWLEKPKKGPS